MSWLTSPRSFSKKVRCNHGFTLIEILVAISIMAIVLTSIYGMFSSVTRAADRLEADGADYHLARVIFDRLGRELRGAYEPSGAEAQTFNGGISAEGRTFLELTTTAVSPLSDSGSGLALVRYELAADEESETVSQVLLRRELPWHQKSAVDTSQSMMRLAPGIDKMTIRFYTSGEWLEEWGVQNSGLPEMVEISLSLRSEDHQVVFRSAFELPRKNLL